MLDIDIRDYVDGQAVFKAAVEKWERFGRIGTPPVLPKPPTYLQLWFELQRWPGHLLVEGGLWDQPAWTWEMVDLAGSIYVSLMEKREIVENG